MNAVWGSVSSGTDTHGHAAHPAGYFEQPAQVKSPQDRAELLSLQRTATANLAEVHKMRVALRQIADKGKRADLERDIATLMKHPGGSAGAAVLPKPNANRQNEVDWNPHKSPSVDASAATASRMAVVSASDKIR